MQPLIQFSHNQVDTLFVDIDGTLTEHGQISARVYDRLWQLKGHGIQVIPVTGRPAGWCDLIARFWPVDGVIGENGGLYYRLTQGKMLRREWLSKEERQGSRKKLKDILKEVKQKLPHLKLAADQFSRRFDLAIDFAEDVGPFPLSDAIEVQKIFERHGAHAKISNIHVNGWFGDFDKLKMCERYCREQLGFDLNQNFDRCAFVGDSANDEPMFKAFKWSFAVANILQFKDQLKSLPQFVSQKSEGEGFCQIADRLIALKKS